MIHLKNWLLWAHISQQWRTRLSKAASSRWELWAGPVPNPACFPHWTLLKHRVPLRSSNLRHNLFKSELTLVLSWSFLYLGFLFIIIISFTDFYHHIPRKVLESQDCIIYLHLSQHPAQDKEQSRYSMFMEWMHKWRHSRWSSSIRAFLPPKL